MVFFSFCHLKLYMLALVDGPVSIAVMHVWFIGFKGHPEEIAGKNKVRPLFLLKRFFCLVKNGFGFGFLVFCELIGPRILGLALPIILLLRSLMSVVGLLMVILPWMLVLTSWRLLSIV